MAHGPKREGGCRHAPRPEVGNKAEMSVGEFYLYDQGAGSPDKVGVRR